MADLKINTDAVRALADTITSVNKQIDSAFPRATNAVSSLQKSWSGPAAEKAFSRFNEIKSTICEPRSTVMKNYANYLRSLIGEGYELVEETNKSLADAFK